MGNILPTITIILAEVTAVLLVALGIMLYFNMRKGRSARTEFETLLDPRPENATAAPVPFVEATGHGSGAPRNDTLQDETSDATPQAAAPAAPAVDPEFAARMEQDIAELRQQMESAHDKLGQLHHDNTLVSKELERMMENERSDVVHVQKDLVQLRKRVEDLESTVETLNTQYADTSRTLHSVRMEVDTLSNEYAAAYSNAMHATDRREKEPSRDPDTQDKQPSPRPEPPETVVAGSPGETTPTPVTDTLPGGDEDEFALPDSALEAFSDAPSDTGESPADEPPARDVAGDPSVTSDPVADANADDTVPPSPTQSDTGDAVLPEERSVEDPEAAGGEESAAVTEGTSTLERLFDAPATFEAGEGREGINVQEISLDELNIDDPHGLTTDPDKPARFEVERVFYQTSTEGPGAGQGWYFSVRGGNVHGPFKDKEAAERVLNEMIRQFQDSGDSGGR